MHRRPTGNGFRPAALSIETNVGHALRKRASGLGALGRFRAPLMARATTACVRSTAAADAISSSAAIIGVCSTLVQSPIQVEATGPRHPVLVLSGAGEGKGVALVALQVDLPHRCIPPRFDAGVAW